MDSFGVPSLTIYYESFDSNLPGTALDVLSFLELNVSFDVRPFRPLPDYRHYFTEAERKASRELVKLFVSNSTWNLLSHYLDM